MSRKPMLTPFPEDGGTAAPKAAPSEKPRVLLSAQAVFQAYIAELERSGAAASFIEREINRCNVILKELEDALKQKG